MLPLDFRRDISDLIIFFKFKSGVMNVDYGKFVTPGLLDLHKRNIHV